MKKFGFVALAVLLVPFSASADITPFAERAARFFAGDYVLNDSQGSEQVKIEIANFSLNFYLVRAGLPHKRFSLPLDQLNIKQDQYRQRWYGIEREMRHYSLDSRQMRISESNEARTWRVETTQDLAFIEGQLHWHFKRNCFVRFLGVGKWKSAPEGIPFHGMPQEFWRRLDPVAKKRSRPSQRPLVSADIIALDARRKDCGRSLAPDAN